MKNVILLEVGMGQASGGTYIGLCLYIYQTEKFDLYNKLNDFSDKFFKVI
jgi:hypothetical protein